MPEVPTIKDKIKNIHEQTRAIIYSFCGVEANYSMKAAETKVESPPFGDEMMHFFKVPYGVYLNRDFLVFLGKHAELALKSSLEKTDILEMVSLFSLVHFLKASFLSIKCCRMRVLQILKNEDID